MDTEQLLAFDRIVREGSFSRAAQVLDLSQPTISARIRTLEEMLGGPLFVRGGRRLALTELGESFLPYARRALAVVEEGREAARLTREGQRGRLTMGVIESLTGGFLASALARFQREHAQVELFIRAGHSDQIVEMLDDGVVKLGLITWPFWGIDLEPLLRFREPLVLVVPAKHALARRGTAELEEVARVGAPLLHVRWGPSARGLMTRLAELNEVAIEVPIDTARQMVLSGVGTAFLTETLVAKELADGRLARVTVTDLPPLHRDSALVKRARGTLTSVADEFVKALREEAGNLLLL